jgi:transcription elongation factor Elf1
MIRLPELKACPFCHLSVVGRLNWTDESAWIECSQCKAETGGKPSFKRAVDEWNEWGNQ